MHLHGANLLFVNVHAVITLGNRLLRWYRVVTPPGLRGIKTCCKHKNSLYFTVLNNSESVSRHSHTKIAQSTRTCAVSIDWCVTVTWQIYHNCKLREFPRVWNKPKWTTREHGHKHNGIFDNFVDSGQMKLVVAHPRYSSPVLSIRTSNSGLTSKRHLLDILRVRMQQDITVLRAIKSSGIDDGIGK